MLSAKAPRNFFTALLVTGDPVITGQDAIPAMEAVGLVSVLHEPVTFRTIHGLGFSHSAPTRSMVFPRFASIHFKIHP